MKLRNKQSGNIYDSDQITFVIYGGEYGEVEETYLSLDELNSDWEEVKPKEPLIKDEKIRKAVRAWAEANVINSGHYYNTDIKFNATEHRLQWIQTAIEFNDIMGLDNLEDGGTYTIDELCGEEEE